MKIFNTLSRKKESFKPIHPKKVLMYHCGPTVYWTQHIGNMRAVVLADLVVRSLNYLGYKVKLVRNYTDVGHLTSDADAGEDKMSKAAKREKLNPEKIAEKYIKEFENDIHALNVPDADKKPRATECIKDSIKMVQLLLDKGYAYATDLAVYFDISKAKDYTRLSQQNLDELIKGAGKAKVEDKNKKNSNDFALWFFKAGKHKNALQYWKSPFYSRCVTNGQGFPGWHLECSVMAKKYLADTIDIHMGGIEHIPIHHTNEIAQSESANDATFVNYWLHNEHLLVDNKKMSKSEGTSYILQKIINKGYNPLALRYFFLQAHYRSKQNFTWQALDAANIAFNKLQNFLKYSTNETPNSTIAIALPKSLLADFVKAIKDDFNIPKALSVLWEVINSRELDYDIKRKLVVNHFDKILGLGLDKIKSEKITIPAEVKKILAQRETARQNKDFKKSDALRKKIEKLGFTIEDTQKGSVVKKK